jgi:hypothetical protein
MYLGGYAIEGVLKTFLISRYSPLTRLSEVRDRMQENDAQLPDICGARGHDLALLWELSGLQGRSTPIVRAAFGECHRWSSNWRYNPEPATRAEASRFVWAARTLYNWVRGQI